MSEEKQAGANQSLWSWRSPGSVLSWRSTGSILSIGSVGSVASIGSVGSFASMLSLGSGQSVGSALSWQSGGSVLSAQASRSVGSYRTDDGWFARYDDGPLPRWVAPSLSLVALAVAWGVTGRGLRHVGATRSCTRRTIAS